MGDVEPTFDEEEVRQLLRLVAADSTLRPPDRSHVRARMIDEFEATVATSGRDRGDVDRGAADTAWMEFGDGVADESGDSFWRRVALHPALVAACLVVFMLVIVTNTRDEVETSDRQNQPAVTPPTTAPRNSVADPRRSIDEVFLPFLLDEGQYFTTEIRGGLSFSGAAGLELVQREPGVIAMEVGDDPTDPRTRITLFEADSSSVVGLIEEAESLGLVTVGEARFNANDESIRRFDLSVSELALSQEDCTMRGPCIALVADSTALSPSAWAGAENFLIEANPGDRPVFVLIQSTSFGNPILPQAFDIVESLRLD